MQLEQLRGVEDRCWVEVAGCERLFAIADEDLERENEVKTSAVHFLRFELSDAMVVMLKGGAALSIGIDHPNYRHELRPVAENLRAALVSDLRLGAAGHPCPARVLGYCRSTSSAPAFSFFHRIAAYTRFAMPTAAGISPNRRACLRQPGVDGEVQNDADQREHDAAAQRLGGADAVDGPLPAPTRSRWQRRQLDALFDGVHALTMVLFEQLRLALVLGPDGQHADADAHDDGDDGNEDANNSRIHNQFSK